MGRRADGYHLLDSLVVFTEVHDTLTVAPAATLSLSVRGPLAPALAVDGATEDNLVLRAAREFGLWAGVAGGARMTLLKRIPVAAGLGGGSSDAAAALRALSRLWGLSPSPAALAGLALDLGADVPVCLDRIARRVSGIGQNLAPAPALDGHLVLANPRLPLATGAVFAGLGGAFGPADPMTAAPAAPGDLGAMLARRRNDLERPAIRLVPAIAGVLGALESLPGCRLARMSGSGPTCFGLFDEPGDAERGAATLARAHPDWWLVATPIVSDAAVLASVAENGPDAP